MEENFESPQINPKQAELASEYFWKCTILKAIELAVSDPVWVFKSTGFSSLFSLTFVPEQIKILRKKLETCPAYNISKNKTDVTEKDVKVLNNFFCSFYSSSEERTTVNLTVGMRTPQEKLPVKLDNTIKKLINYATYSKVVKQCPLAILQEVPLKMLGAVDTTEDKIAESVNAAGDSVLTHYSLHYPQSKKPSQSKKPYSLSRSSGVGDSQGNIKIPELDILLKGKTSAQAKECLPQIVNIITEYETSTPAFDNKTNVKIYECMDKLLSLVKSAAGKHGTYNKIGALNDSAVRKINMDIANRDLAELERQVGRISKLLAKKPDINTCNLLKASLVRLNENGNLIKENYGKGVDVSVYCYGLVSAIIINVSLTFILKCVDSENKTHVIKLLNEIQQGPMTQGEIGNKPQELETLLQAIITKNTPDTGKPTKNQQTSVLLLRESIDNIKQLERLMEKLPLNTETTTLSSGGPSQFK